jgi:DNA-binding GntR family transcriptional regulator
MSSASAGIAADHIRADSVLDLAYGRIRALVLEGEILRGTRLGQVELAERLGVSRTPVREALRRLAGECLAEFVPNRG